MAKKLWNKLVRDNVPDQLRARGIKVVSHHLRAFSARDQHGRNKLREEASEVLKAKTKQELLEELADLDEVKDALLALHGFSNADLLYARARKNDHKGAFEKWRYLESTEE
jgi:predicted house-cleaning noncanonical NTP pyrophosphatase (MazG superfamily)